MIETLKMLNKKIVGSPINKFPEDENIFENTNKAKSILGALPNTNEPENIRKVKKTQKKIYHPLSFSIYFFSNKIFLLFSRASILNPIP
jgi:hypothetical protein